MKRFDFVEIGSWIVAVVFIVIATLAVNALVNHCSNPHHPAPDTQHLAPGIQWRTKYVPQPAETIYQTKRIPPEPVDTQEIIRQYLAEHIYRDTVFHNDTAMLVIRDTLWRNAIAGREVTLTFNSDRFARHHSLGLLTSLGSNHAAVMAAYRHKQWFVAAGYDFPQQSPTVSVGYLYNW